MNKIFKKIGAEIAYEIFLLPARISLIVNKLFVADVLYGNFTSSPRYIENWKFEIGNSPKEVYGA